MADDVICAEMIEIDPNLFITCRLCLEHTGLYQIVPTVQQQIKYCFEINVEPFDGLPQLLCRQCKVLLDEYSARKKKYIEKQQSLITRLKVKQIQNSKGEDKEDSIVQNSKGEDKEDSIVQNSKGEDKEDSIVQNCKGEDKADSIVSSSSFTLPQSRTYSRSRSPISSSKNNQSKNATNKEHELVDQPGSVNSADNSTYDSESNIKLPKTKSHTNYRKRKSRLLSSSSSDTEVSTIFKKKAKKHRSKSPKWCKKYKKLFVCNICSKTYSDRRKLKKHFNAHSHIKSKYDFVLNNECRVKLIKCDGKPNITNLYDTVIFDKGKIIQNDGNSLYHILYTARDNDTSILNENTKKHKNDNAEKHKTNYSESSDDAFTISRKAKRKFQRISRSSNETVLLDDMNKTREGSNADENESSRTKTSENKATECINIDDSSDNNTDLDNCDDSKQTTDAKVEFKTIENIISNCRLKYMKKLESAQNSNNNSSKKMIYSEAQLKHKLLSIGRKNIYKEGQFNCTGLLRFMEHKNLNIQWLPKDTRDSLVRIMTKLKSANINDNAIDKSGWITLPESGPDTPNSAVSNVTNAPEIVNESSVCNVKISAVASKSNASVMNTDSVNTSQPLPIVHLIPAKLYKDCQNPEVDLHSKKILNPSPVANPKQLPKKSNLNDSKAKNEAKNVEVKNKSYVRDLDEQLTRQLDQEENYTVPVITSTTSLAVGYNNEKPPETAKAPDNSAPRIKVKPVSELMNPPNARVNENSNINNIWALNSIGNRVTPSIENGGGNIYFQLVPQIQNVHSLHSLHRIAPAPERNLIPINRVTSDAANVPASEVIILNSEKLPNTSTDSPFKYLRDLLILHELILLDPNTVITEQYVSLIKMKVQYKQESKEVTLCLSLFCLRNAFCICIKNNNNTDIPMDKISAIWQWEIIKVFRGDNSSKILDNSMKAGQLVYNSTKTFLSVLKSITCEQH